MTRFVVKNDLAFTRFRTVIKFSPLGLNYTEHTIDSYEFVVGNVKYTSSFCIFETSILITKPMIFL